MTSKQQKKLKKKKGRERESKKKVLLRREAARTVAKEKKAEEAVLDQEFEVLKPYVKESTRIAKEKARDDEIKAQIARNIEILKALEEEHLKSEAERDKINQEFEDAGLKTPEEKLEFLKAKAQLEGLGEDQLQLE